MAKGLSRAEAAAILTALCRKKLVESGYPVAAFGITESEVTAALEQRMGLEAVAEPVEDVPIVPLASKEQVREVWSAWLQAMGQDATTTCDLKSETLIEARLAFGFSPADLVEVCTKVVADPSLVKRTKIKAISRVLASDRQVCGLLGRKYERPVRATWLTPFEKVWRDHYPQGEVPFGVMAKALAPLVSKYSEAAVIEELDCYLEQTNIAYVSWPKFAQGFGTWSYGDAKGKGSRASYARDALSAL